MPARDVIVIGASLGGIEALSALVGMLPRDLPAAVCIVQHTSKHSSALLADILATRGSLPAVTAEDGMVAERSHIYVAPPSRHMLLTVAGLRVVFGPRENRARPAIDPLFRTAAVHFRSRVIGVILTGLLDDGAAGLLAVKRCGGLTVAQSPADAAYGDMPRHAIEAVGVDHQGTVEDIGALLRETAGQSAPDPPVVPEELQLEARLNERAMEDANWKQLPSRPAPYTCPECGGSLREIEDDRLHRYRCHVGHAYRREAVLQSQEDGIEAALWVAMRTLDERARMLQKMARDESDRGHHQSASEYEERACETRECESRLRDFIRRISPDEVAKA